MKKQNKKNIFLTKLFLFILLFILLSISTNNSLLCKNKNIPTFTTLEEIEEYAKKYPDDVKSDNNDFEDPIFLSFYKKYFIDSTSQYLKNKIGIAKKKKFNIFAFKELLEKVTEFRLNAKEKNNNLNINKNLNKQNISQKYDWQSETNLQKDISSKKASQIETPFYGQWQGVWQGKSLNLELERGDKVIIFGDIQAAFHSFSRCLRDLKNKGIIDSNLKILKDNYYIVIIGDAINKNPYSIETLNIILLLMHKNPNKFIYNQGKHEKNGYWENFHMTNELKIKAERLVKDVSIETPLLNELNTFFDTLSDTIVIRHKNLNPENITTDIGQNNQNITPDNTNPENINSKINPENISQEKIIITHSYCKPELLDANTKIIIYGEKKFDILKESSGLEFIGYDGGAATWSTLSCPTTTYQTFFNFYKDAYSELEIEDTFLNSKINLYNRDIRDIRDIRDNSPDKTFKKTSYNPIFGFKLKDANEKKLSKNNIFNLGSSIALTGVTGPLGHENKVGLETSIYFNNQDNLTKNNLNNLLLIKPTIFDDENIPKNSLSNIKKLIKNYDTQTIILPTGDINLSQYLELVKNNTISVLFPCDGSETLRKQEFKNVIHFRPSYEQEVKALINYLFKEYGIKNFAFFYMDDDTGKAMTKIAHEELQKLGIKKWLDLSHIKTESDFEYTIKNIKKKMPEAIACFSSLFATQEFINQLGGDFFSGRILCGPSYLYSQTFEKFLSYRGINSVFSLIVPYSSQNYTQNIKSLGNTPDSNKNYTQNIKSWSNTPDLEIIKEFEEKITQRALEANANTLEGYISGELLSLALENVFGKITDTKYEINIEKASSSNAVKNSEINDTKIIDTKIMNNKEKNIREEIVKFFESMNKYKFKGLELTFNPITRDLSQPVWIKKMNNKIIKY